MYDYMYIYYIISSHFIYHHHDHLLARDNIYLLSIFSMITNKICLYLLIFFIDISFSSIFLLFRVFCFARSTIFSISAWEAGLSWCTRSSFKIITRH